MSQKPVDDDTAYNLLHSALLALGTAPGETTRGNTALEAARTMLRLLQLGLVKVMEDNADHVEGLTSGERSPSGPGSSPPATPD